MPPAPKSIRFRSQLVEPSPKRQRMSSDTSESTLASDDPVAAVIDPGACWVASDDLSSMVFQTAYLQRIISSWNGYVPLVYGETLMKSSFKKCQDTVNSLRNTLESLEVKAAKDAQSPMKDFIASWHRKLEDQQVKDEKEAKSAATMEFLILSGIEKIVNAEFSRLCNLDEVFFDITYKSWNEEEGEKGTFRHAIKKALDKDPDPLADFETKVKRHFKREMLDRAASDFKRELQKQYEEYGG
ncbi:hypothetical protein KCU81_g9878, partial [Aureobasidium melanogenum]|uniref:Uncharacterized protein n=1 Tax=Aureobasidium melanogenum (strain CBS 110374) TaxID=1043003 RepID=A0A074WED7_AURM1